MKQLPLPPALGTDLQQVEQIVSERTHSRAAVISVAGSRLLRPQGVRLRAALVLMAARTGAYSVERVVHAAAAVELLHAATQTHEDLVDEAERRRGRPSVGEWSSGISLMVGDYLFALAAGEMALAPDARVIGYYAQAVQRITESTLVPAPPLLPLDLALSSHLERIGGTAAALVAAACQAGGACAGALPAQIETLGQLGYALGLALRLGDELHDFAADDGSAPPATSLRAGAVTTPLIFAAHFGDGTRLATAIDSGDPGEQAWATAEVAAHGIAPTRAELGRLVGQARATLSELPSGAGRNELALVADWVAVRA